MHLDTFIDVDAFVREIDSEIGDLNEAMRTQTARAAWYGICYSKAQKQLGRVKLTLKAIEAKLTTKYRATLKEEAEAEAAANGTKPERITTDMVQAAVSIDNNSLSWQQKLLDAQEIESVCKVAYYAFKTREEMLKSMGILTQAQLKSNMTIQGARDAVRGYDARRQARGSSPRAAAETNTDQD